MQITGARLKQDLSINNALTQCEYLAAVCSLFIVMERGPNPSYCYQ